MDVMLAFSHRRTLWVARLRLKCDDKRAETKFRPSAKRTSPFKSAGASVQSTTGSRGVCISGSNSGFTPCSEVVWRVLDTHSIRQFPLHFPSRASPCAVTFQLDSKAGDKLSSCHVSLRHVNSLLPYPFPCVGCHMLNSIIWWLGVI